MKKLIAGAVAGAMLLSVATVALASVNQYSFTSSKTLAVSNTGANAGGFFVKTGDSNAAALSGTASNVNVGGGRVNQGAFTTSTTVAVSNTGLNHGGAGAVTGNSGAVAGSVTVSNVSVR